MLSNVKFVVKYVVMLCFAVYSFPGYHASVSFLGPIRAIFGTLWQHVGGQSIMMYIVCFTPSVSVNENTAL